MGPVFWYMNSILEFFPIGPTYHISKMLKQPQLSFSVGSYSMSEAGIVDSFQHILDLEFGGDMAPVIKFLTRPEKLERIDGIGGLQHQLSYHASLVNSKLTAAIIRLHEPEAI